MLSFCGDYAMFKSRLIALAASITLASLSLVPASAQVTSVDPDIALENETVSEPDYGSSGTTTDDGTRLDTEDSFEEDTTVYSDPGYVPDTPGNESLPAGTADADTSTTVQPGQTTYQQDDLMAAAGGVFGDGAEGLARMIQRILADQGEPNGYIVGREAGGAFIVGLRYGSGTLYHAVEGDRPVYWTGPSVGFDIGANGASTFVLVYNLYDSEELFRRFPAVEGDAYFIGGLTASYLRSGDKVLIPIRLGAGLRLGANVGYMNFSRNRRWLPF